MSRGVAALKEWINPDRAKHRPVAPLEAGLRPNSMLDEAEAITEAGRFEPEDVLATANGEWLFTSGTEVLRLSGNRVHVLAEVGFPVGTLAAMGDDVIVAAEGRGLVAISSDGAVSNYCTDESLKACVTDITTLSDGTVLASVGSNVQGRDQWAWSLVKNDCTGSLVRADASRCEAVAQNLPWPSGVAAGEDEEIVISLSLAHRIERRTEASLEHGGEDIVTNLPVYPGRLRHVEGGWWVTAPYARNRATELILDEPDLCADMVQNIVPHDWLVPRLRSDNPYTDPLQMGQLRVMGKIKPWAPPRSYGLLFMLGYDGRIHSSMHSRVDGTRHGITGVGATEEEVVIAGQGCRTLLRIKDVGNDD